MIGADEAAMDTDSETPARRPLWRRLATRNMLYVLALVFFAIVLWRSKFWESGDAIDRLTVERIILIPLLSVLIAVPLALRQRAILGALGHRFPAWSLAPLSYYGNTVGFMTPAASGELLRPALFQRIFGLPLPLGVGVVLYERLYSLFLFVLACLVALSWTDLLPRGAGVVLLPVFVVSCLLPSATVKLAPALRRALPLGRLANLVPHRQRDHVGDSVRESGATLQQLWSSPRLTVTFIALSVAVFLVMGGQFWLIQDGLGQDLTLQEAWVVLGVSAMAGVASGLPLGIGATDAVMLSLLRAYGVDTSTAGSIVILSRTLINLPTGIFGLCAYLIAIRQRPAGPAESPPESAPQLASASTSRIDE
jgi:uncharacterized protein (TIRG00374 family)